ncbi:glucokinase [Francisellaceae bacterium]|nr:glucokinase [Francisellaceae bacterium]
MIVLSGDIGGTNTRLQLTQHTSSGASAEILFTKKYKGADYKSLTEILTSFVKESNINRDQIHSACIAVAGPVVNGEAELTNLPWFVTEVEMKTVLQTKYVKIINDFESIGYGIETLTEKDLHTLQKGKYEAKAPVSFVGAGTGIGVGIALYHKGDTIVCPTEGGHVDFAPVGDEQTELLQYLRKKLRRVSVERICCGTGLINIYKHIINNPHEIYKESPEMHLAMYNSKDEAATIAEFAFTHKDPVAIKVFDIFIKVYGSTAGNLALTTLPKRGMYIVGGIAPKILDQMTDGRFMDMFLDKGRMSHILEDVPVHICLNTDVGLQGAAQHALSIGA